MADKKENHGVRNTIMTLLTGGGIAGSAYMTNKKLPGGFMGTYRQYLDNPQQLTTAARIISEKVTAKTKYVDINAPLNIIKTLQERMIDPGVIGQVTDLENASKQISGQIKSLRTDVEAKLEAKGRIFNKIKEFRGKYYNRDEYNKQIAKQNLARIKYNKAIQAGRKPTKGVKQLLNRRYYRSGEDEVTQLIYKAIEGGKNPQYVPPRALKYTVDEIKNMPSAAPLIKKIYEKVYKKEGAKLWQLEEQWRIADRAHREAVALNAKLNPGLKSKNKTILKKLRKLAPIHDYQTMIMGSKEFMSQEQLRIQEAVIQSQIDLVESIYGSQLDVKAALGPEQLTKLGAPRLQTHLRYINPKDLPVLFSKLNLPEDHILALQAGVPLGETLSSVEKWLNTINNSTALTVDQKETLISSLTRRLHKHKKMIMPDMLFEEYHGIQDIDTAYKGPDFFSKYVAPEKTDIEVELLRANKNKMSRLLRKAGVTQRPGFAGVLDRTTKQGKGLVVNIDDQSFMIPFTHSLSKEEKSIQWLPSSINSPNSVELAMGSVLTREEVAPIIKRSGLSSRNAKLLNKMSHVVVSSDVRTMMFINQYLEKVIEEQGKNRVITKKTIIRNLKEITKTVAAKHSVWQRTQKELGAEGKPYRGIKDFLVTSYKSTVDRLLNPFRAHEYSSRALLNFTMTIDEDLNVSFDKHQTMDDIRKASSMFTEGATVFTHELQFEIDKWHKQGVSQREINRRIKQYSRVRMDVGDKQVGTMISSASGPVARFDSDMRLTNERTTISGMLNQQLSSPTAMALAEEAELKGHGGIYYHKAISTIGNNELIQRYIKSGFNPEFDYTPTFTGYYMDTNVAEAILQNKGGKLSREAIIAAQSAAKGHILIPKTIGDTISMPGMLGHIVSENIGVANVVDVSREMKRLEQLGDQAIGQGMYLGGGKFVEGKPNTIIREVNVGPFNPVNKEHTVTVVREVLGSDFTKGFGKSGRERALTTAIKEETFNELIEFIEDYLTKNKRGAGLNLKGIKALTAGKEIGTGQFFQEFEQYHFAMLSDLVTGKGSEPIIQRIGQENVLNAGMNIKKRLKTILELTTQQTATKEEGKLINRLSKLFKEDTASPYSTPFTVFYSEEGSKFVEQAEDVRSYLKKLGVDIYQPLKHIKFAPSDIPRVAQHPKLAFTAMLKLLAEEPEVAAHYLKNTEGIEHLQASLYALASPDIRETKILEENIQKLKAAGKAEVLTLNDFSLRTVSTTQQLRDLYESGDFTRINTTLNTGDFGNKSIFIDLGKEIELAEDTIRYIPILPRKLISNIDTPFETAAGPVMGDYDKLLSELLYASKTKDEVKQKEMLSNVMTSIKEVIAGKSGALVQAFTPRQEGGVNAIVAFNPIADEMADELINIQKIGNKSLAEYTQDYFSKKKNVTDYDIKKMFNNIISNSNLSTSETMNVKKGTMAGIELPQQMLSSHEGMNRNLYEDIMEGRLQLVSGTVRGKKETRLRYDHRKVLTETHRDPTLQQFPFFRNAAFVDFDNTEWVQKVGARMLALKNMDFDYDIHNVIMFNRAAYEKEVFDIAPQWYKLGESIESRLATIAGVEDASAHSMEAMAVRTSGAVTDYREFEQVSHKFDIDSPEWRNLQKEAVESAAQISFTGKATRFQERLIYGLSKTDTDELERLTGLKGVDLARARLHAGFLSVAVPQEAIKVKAGEGSRDVVSTLERLEALLMTDDMSKDNLNNLWHYFRPSVVAQYGDGDEGAILKSSIGGEALESAPNVLSDTGENVMKIYKAGFQTFKKKLPILNTLFTDENISSKNVSSLINSVVSSLTKGGESPLPSIYEMYESGYAKKGVLPLLSRVAHSGVYGPAIGGGLAAIGLYAASEFGSNISKDLENRPESYIIDNAVPSASDNMAPLPNYDQPPIQFNPPAPQPPTTRLTLNENAKTVDIDYVEEQRNTQKLQESFENINNRVFVINDQVNRSKAFLEYKAKREL